METNVTSALPDRRLNVTTSRRPHWSNPGLARFALALLSALLLTACDGSGPTDDPSRVPPTGAAPSAEPSDGRRSRTTPPATVRARPEQFLGRTIDDTELIDYLIRNECFPGLGNWNCPRVSTEFSLNTGSRVVSVMFKAPSVTNPAGYRGPLPAGMSFTDTPDELAARFGPPLAGKVGPNGFLKWQDGNLALFVNFFPQAPLRIHQVKLGLQ
jgi:hypothetical protein